MSPSQMQKVAMILARLLVLDGASAAPDAQDLREVCRAVLEEQLRELQTESPELDDLRRLPRKNDQDLPSD